LWFAPIFDDSFKKLDKPMKELAWKEIQSLKEEPDKGEHLLGILRGLRSIDVKSHKSNCRVVYKISNDKTKVIIIVAGTHKETYKWLERYLRNIRKSAYQIFEP